MKLYKPLNSNICSLFSHWKTSLYLLVVGIFLQIGCSNNKSSKNTNAIIKSENNAAVIVDTVVHNLHEQTNYTDVNGFKQGIWVKEWSGKIIEKATYKDDLLDGYFISLETGGGIEGNYKLGKREGIFYYWYTYRQKALAVTYYINDTIAWQGYPAANEKYLIPLKSFHIYVDTVYIVAPYETGKTWYEGNFCQRQIKSSSNFKSTTPIGVHKIYFRNGAIKGIVDYTTETIQEFDSTGIMLYKTGFYDFQTHHQPI